MEAPIWGGEIFVKGTRSFWPIVCKYWGVVFRVASILFYLIPLPIDILMELCKM